MGSGVGWDLGFQTDRWNHSEMTMADICALWGINNAFAVQRICSLPSFELEKSS
jgi:hypothetical protein